MYPDLMMYVHIIPKTVLDVQDVVRSAGLLCGIDDFEFAVC
jgi:hypothetical protein